MSTGDTADGKAGRDVDLTTYSFSCKSEDWVELHFQSSLCLHSGYRNNFSFCLWYWVLLLLLLVTCFNVSNSLPVDTVSSHNTWVFMNTALRTLNLEFWINSLNVISALHLTYWIEFFLPSLTVANRGVTDGFPLVYHLNLWLFQPVPFMLARFQYRLSIFTWLRYISFLLRHVFRSKVAQAATRPICIRKALTSDLCRSTERTEVILAFPQFP